MHEQYQPPAGAATDALDLATARIVDLSQPLGPATPPWPGAERVRTVTHATIAADGLYDRDLALPEHVGTHLDAPAHFAADGAFAHELPPHALVRPLRRIDVRDLVGDDAGAVVRAASVHAAEAADGELAPGCAVVFHTGWDRFLHDDAAYVGPHEGPTRFPGLGPDVARLLVERGVVGVGIDTLGVDPGHAGDYPFHRITLPAGLWHLEGLVGLEQVPHRGAWLLVGALPIARGSGAPARVLAALPRDP